MKLLVLTTTLCLLGKAYSQFYVKGTFMETYDVSNTGEVVGYTEWGGPYMIWTPETGHVDTINGLAPGNGIGSRSIFSHSGNFISGTAQGPNGPEMARYNRSNDTWTTLGSLGYTIDGNYSGGFAISGDGNTVVGLSWADTTGGYAYAHGVAWNAAEGIIDLGSQFIGRSTRANFTNTDGSIIVGWQDFNGPWKSAVWRKNPAGGYFPNEYILLNPAGSTTDEYNQMGECTAISANGNWIGGEGDYANNNHPWIWSEATGVVDLGTLNENGRGYVADLNEDGTQAVGRIQIGPWDPDLPFIWTVDGGIENLNQYAENTLGLDLGSNVLYSANAMSSDGNYIAGYGVDTLANVVIAYRISMLSLGVNEFASTPIKLWPNPSSGELTLTTKEKTAIVTICDAKGEVVRQLTISGTTTIDISSLNSGVYVLTLKENGQTRTSRLIKG